MNTAITLNKSEISAAAGRPVSLVAALGILGCSLLISHAGLVAVFKPGPLSAVLTCVLVFCSTLQWMSMGRARAARATGAASQATLTIINAAILYVVEAVLNTIGVVQLAAEGGSDWGSGLAFIFAIAIAMGIAWLNLTVKFAACEPLVSTARQAQPVTVEIEPPPAARDLPPNVHELTAYARQHIATQSPERVGLQTFYREQEDVRQAELAALAARKDPVTGQWKPKAATPAQPARTRARKRA